MNKRIIETRKKMIDILNEARLPLAVMDLILAEVRGIVQAQLPGELQKEEETEKAQKESKAKGEK